MFNGETYGVAEARLPKHLLPAIHDISLLLLQYMRGCRRRSRRCCCCCYQYAVEAVKHLVGEPRRESFLIQHAVGFYNNASVLNNAVTDEEVGG